MMGSMFRKTFNLKAVIEERSKSLIPTIFGSGSSCLANQRSGREILGSTVYPFVAPFTLPLTSSLYSVCIAISIIPDISTSLVGNLFDYRFRTSRVKP